MGRSATSSKFGWCQQVLTISIIQTGWIRVLQDEIIALFPENSTYTTQLKSACVIKMRTNVVVVFENEWTTFCWCYAIVSRAVAWWRHQMDTFSALLALCVGTSPVTGEFPHKGRWRGVSMFPLICAWINDWANNREAGDLRRHRIHYDVTVMWVTTPESGSLSSIITLHCSFLPLVDNLVSLFGPPYVIFRPCGRWELSAALPSSLSFFFFTKKSSKRKLSIMRK